MRSVKRHRVAEMNPLKRGEWKMLRSTVLGYGDCYGEMAKMMNMEVVDEEMVRIVETLVMLRIYHKKLATGCADSK